MIAAARKIKRYWFNKSLYDKVIITGSVVFIGVGAYYAILHRVFFTPDQFYVLAFLVALILGQTKKFLWDWTPVVLLILSYEYLRGLVPMVNQHVHFNLMPMFDKMLFAGRIPAVVLQNLLYTADHLHWYDYASVTLYLSHFIIPLLTAFIFWLTDRPYFKEFVIGIIALTYMTFLTYLIFPAAPPWMASQMGTVPPLQHITGIILGHFYNYLAVPNVYGYFGINLTAAVPSLHAAFPLLTAIYIYKKAPKLAPVLILYVLGVWFSVMYLGEHYFFDVFLGSLYVLVVYAVLQRIKSYVKVKRKIPVEMEI